MASWEPGLKYHQTNEEADDHSMLNELQFRTSQTSLEEDKSISIMCSLLLLDSFFKMFSVAEILRVKIKLLLSIFYNSTFIPEGWKCTLKARMS